MHSSRLSAAALVASLVAVPALFAHAGVADEVAAAQAGAPAAPAPAPEPGLYLLPPGATAPDGLVRLRMNMPEDMRQSGTFGSMITGGHSRQHMYAKITGARSRVRVPAGELDFYFYFGESAGKLPTMQDPSAAMASVQSVFGDAPPWNATRPEDFQLVHLTVEGDAREAETGSFGGRRGASGASRDAVAVAVEKLGAREFHVRTSQPVAPGEYGFYFAGQGPGWQIWDFGVDPG